MRSRLFHFKPLRGLAIAPAVLGLLSLQFGCDTVMFWRSKPQEMHSASDVPASEGTVRVSKGGNGNTKISVRVKHLAPPSKLAPDTTVYIVWVQPQDGEKQNVGALVLNRDLEGSLETLTPLHRFKLYVTPEANAQVVQAFHEAVFTYNVESDK